MGIGRTGVIIARRHKKTQQLLSDTNNTTETLISPIACLNDLGHTYDTNKRRQNGFETVVLNSRYNNVNRQSVNLTLISVLQWSYHPIFHQLRNGSCPIPRAYWLTRNLGRILLLRLDAHREIHMREDVSVIGCKNDSSVTQPSSRMTVARPNSSGSLDLEEV